MPDLQTALSSVAKQINFDDDLEVAPTEYKNSAQKLFYWFVDNPASTVKECMQALNLTKNGPVSGRIHQLYSRGVLTRVDGVGGYRYTTTCTVYPELTTERRRELIKKAHAARKPKKHKKVKVSNVAFIPPKSAPSLNANPNAEQIVNSMSVGLAKAVYLELKKVFEA